MGLILIYETQNVMFMGRTGKKCEDQPLGEFKIIQAWSRKTFVVLASVKNDWC